MRVIILFLVVFSYFSAYCQQWEKVGNLPSTDLIGSNSLVYDGKLYLFGTTRINNQFLDFSYWDGKEWTFIPFDYAKNTGFIGKTVTGFSLTDELLVSKFDTLCCNEQDLAIFSNKKGSWEIIYKRSKHPSNYRGIGDFQKANNKIYIRAQKDTILNSTTYNMYDVLEVIDSNTVNIIPVKLASNSGDACKIHVLNDELYLSTKLNPGAWGNGQPLDRLNKWDGTQWVKVGTNELRNGAEYLALYDGKLVAAGRNYDWTEPISSGVQMLNMNNEWVSIAGMQMVGDIKELIQHKNKLYAIEENRKIWVYNNVTWDTINDQTFEDTLFAGNRPLYNLCVYKDELYASGTFQKIDNAYIKDIAKIALLNDLNLAPDAVNDLISLDENDSILVSIKANDIDANADYLLTEVLQYPKHGTVTVTDGDELFYTPDLYFENKDTIRYKICDRGGLCDSAWVYITVNPVGMVSLLPENNIIIYPNPATDQFRIRSKYSLTGTAKLYDLTGKLLSETLLNDTDITVSVADLKPGVYFIRLQTSEGVYQQKLIRQ